jgi:hypothetical protein
MDGVGSLGEDLPEDLEELGLLDLSIVGGVDGLDEFVDIGLAGSGAVGVQVLHGGADEVEGLLPVKGVAVVLVELLEDGVNGLSELIVGISHILQINYTYSLTPTQFMLAPSTKFHQENF